MHQRLCSFFSSLQIMLIEGESPSKTHAFLSFQIIQAPKIIKVFTPFLCSLLPRDIQGGLSLAGIRESLQLWDCLLEIILTDQEDRHTWRLDASGCYSSKSAYKAFFYGAVTFEPWRRLWKTWAPAKCKMFLWLAIRNRCWTAEGLLRGASLIRINARCVIKKMRQYNIF